MRVIAGSAKGHRLVAPNSPRVRPALDKVKGAIFNILFDVEEMRVLDLFAGSGAIGIEALSRGAALAVFVEEWDKAAESIERNLLHCKLSEKARIVRSGVDRAIGVLSRRDESFDLVFVDPPYLKDLVNRTLGSLASSGIVAKDGLVIVEHHPKEPIVPPIGLSLTDSRKYGQTCIAFLRKTAGEILPGTVIGNR